MEKVLSGDLSKTFMLFRSKVRNLATLMVQFITNVYANFKTHQKSTFLYLLVCLLFFLIISVTTHPAVLINPVASFVFYQLYFLLLGSAHVYFMRSNLHWSGQETSSLSEIIFTLIICLLGSLVFITIYRYLNHNGIGCLMVSSTCFFVVPFFFYYTFHKVNNILNREMSIQQMEEYDQLPSVYPIQGAKSYADSANKTVSNINLLDIQPSELMLKLLILKQKDSRGYNKVNMVIAETFRKLQQTKKSFLHVDASAEKTCTKEAKPVLHKQN